MGPADARYPPGPSLLSYLLTAKPLWQSPADTLKENARRYGDLVHIRALEGHLFQFNHPALIQELLTENEKHNRRILVMQRAKSFLGDGLLTSEEPLHMRQRRMAAPAFHRQRITAYADAIAHFAAEITSRWQPGVRDLHPEMLLIALRIVGKTLFNIDDEAEALEITSAFNAFRGGPLPPAWVPEKLLVSLQKIPFGAMLKIKQGMAKIDAIIYGMIAERRRSPGDRGDLLSMLLEATDTEDAPGNQPGRMTDKLLRDECLTIILAGHETTANVLSFAMWLLAKHPEVQEGLHEEAVRVLGTRRPQAADYPQLRYSYMVFAEVMRLYPTVWVIGRSCGPEPYQFHGFTIPPGAGLLAPQIVVHRDPRFWDDPETFNPLRFSDEARTSRPRYAYFPFGGGSRQCIGEALAWMEGVFTLTTIARDWRLKPLPGAPDDLPIQASINLRPKNGVPLVLEAR